MPSRAPSRCPCGVITPAGSLCPCRARRRQAAKAEADTRRPSAAARGYGSKWTAARKDFLSVNPRCIRCGAPANVVDHIEPHRLGQARTEDERRAALKLFWRRSNWQPLCASPCHNRAKQAEEHRAAGADLLSPSNLTIGSITQSIEDWAADYGIPCALIRSRLNKGWSNERAVTLPMTATRYRLTPADMRDDLAQQKTKQIDRERRTRFYGTLEHNGKSMTVRMWADHLGVDAQVIYYRLRKGYPISDVLDGKSHSGRSPHSLMH